MVKHSYNIFVIAKVIPDSEKNLKNEKFIYIFFGGIRGVSFLTRHKRGQTCESRDYQGKVAGKRTPDEGHFRPAKIREQRSEQQISALCLLHPFGAQKGEIEITTYKLATID